MPQRAEALALGDRQRRFPTACVEARVGCGSAQALRARRAAGVAMLDAWSTRRPEAQAGSLARAEKAPVGGGELPVPASGWAPPATRSAGRMALHGQMCVSRLLRKIPPVFT